MPNNRLLVATTLTNLSTPMAPLLILLTVAIAVNAVDAVENLTEVGATIQNHMAVEAVVAIVVAPKGVENNTCNQSWWLQQRWKFTL